MKPMGIVLIVIATLFTVAAMIVLYFLEESRSPLRRRGDDADHRQKNE